MTVRAIYLRITLALIAFWSTIGLITWQLLQNF
jgi:hypothetical protein